MFFQKSIWKNNNYNLTEEICSTLLSSTFCNCSEDSVVAMGPPESCQELAYLDSTFKEYQWVKVVMKQDFYQFVLTWRCNASILKTKYNDEQNKKIRSKMTKTDMIVDLDKWPRSPTFPEDVELLLRSGTLWPGKWKNFD